MSCRDEPPKTPHTQTLGGGITERYLFTLEEIIIVIIMKEILQKRRFNHRQRSLILLGFYLEALCSERRTGTVFSEDLSGHLERGREGREG